MTEEILDIEPAKGVLSIQSHVVHGYVGNKAATFPLQMLNWNVDVLNTVNFSNHTGYGILEGKCSTKEDLLELYKGLKNIDAEYDALLTGYVNGFGTLQAVGEICVDVKKRSKSKNREVLWILDPVMGDEGQLYVEENVIPIYRQLLDTKMVDVITPNQYELELLIDHKITCMNTLRKALSLFHERYHVKHVILSTLFAKQFDDLEGGPETLYCCISSTALDKLVLYRIDKIEGYFTGVGDMFSALLTDRMSKSDDIIKCVNEALSVMRQVLTLTKALSKTKGEIGNLNMKDCELRVIESKNFFVDHSEFYDPIFMDKHSA